MSTIIMKDTKALTFGAVGMSFTVSRATHIDYTCISSWVYHACGTYYMPVSACISSYALFSAHKMADRGKPYRSDRWC